MNNKHSANAVNPSPIELVALGCALMRCKHPAEAAELAKPPRDRGKAPDQGNAWQQQAPMSAQEAAQFDFAQNNLAIRCGRVEGAALSLVFIDQDDQKARSWFDAEVAAGRIPKVPNHPELLTGLDDAGLRRRSTPYRRPEVNAVPNRIKAAHPDGSIMNLDVKADAGYVIAPGSTHGSGATYQAIGDWTPEALAALPVYDPSWIPAKPARPASVPPAELPDVEALLALPANGPRKRENRFKLYLDSCEGSYPGILPAGAGAHCLVIARFGAWGLCLDPEVVARIMHAHPWNASCHSGTAERPGSPYPWSKQDLLHKARDAAKPSRSIDAPRGHELKRSQVSLLVAAANAAAADDAEDDLADDDDSTISSIDLFGDDISNARAKKAAKTGNCNWADQLSCERGAVKSHCGNVITILENDPRWEGVLQYDELLQGVRKLAPPPWFSGKNFVPGTWTDQDDTETARWLLQNWKVGVTSPTVLEAVEVAARKNSVHPVRQKLTALKWDRVKRVDAWLSTYLGVADSAYSRMVGRYFLISCVARALKPGAKVDTLLILEGPQGTYKSQAVRALAGIVPDVFADTQIDLESKDRFQQLCGIWIYELAELDSLERSAAAKVKNYISSPEDNYRASYGRRSVKRPRSAVFVGTINPQSDRGYFKDATGNRRFWPVRCGRIDLRAIERDRDQLWAEATALFLAGSRWWTEGADASLCEAEQKKREHTGDTWVEAIREEHRRYLLGDVAKASRKDRPYEALTKNVILTKFVKKDLKDQTKADSDRIGSLLRELRLVQTDKTVRTDCGVGRHIWFVSESCECGLRRLLALKKAKERKQGQQQQRGGLSPASRRVLGQALAVLQLAARDLAAPPKPERVKCEAACKVVDGAIDFLDLSEAPPLSADEQKVRAFWSALSTVAWAVEPKDDELVVDQHGEEHLVSHGGLGLKHLAPIHDALVQLAQQ